MLTVLALHEIVVWASVEAFVAYTIEGVHAERRAASDGEYRFAILGKLEQTSCAYKELSEVVCVWCRSETGFTSKFLLFDHCFLWTTFLQL